MKTLPVVLTTCLALLTAGTLTLLSWQYRQSRQLAAEKQQLTEALRESEQTIATLTLENAAVSDQLRILETSQQELRGRMDALEEADRAAAGTLPQPYRVRAFLGQDNVGGAWIVPHNVRRDAASGRYVFEPLLVIDESAKGHFTVNHTNVVEREVHTTEIYEAYNPYPYYYYVTPGRPGYTNRPPTGSHPPTRPPVTVSPQIPQADARARLFAPPGAVVNSRPQVLGTPATSPVNARVFAP